MSILKDSKHLIKPFKFGALVPEQNDKNHNEDKISAFEMKPLKVASDFQNNLTSDLIRKERELEAQTSFSIDPLVKEHRGLKSQETQDYENAVQQEIEKRLELLSKQAYEEGVNLGRKDGEKKAYDEMLERYEEKINFFAKQIEQLVETRQDILNSSVEEGYKLIKNLTKWIVLKEVDDKEYILRLLEKLILEMNSKANLLIRVDQESFNDMPEILTKIQEKLGQLTNTRVEIDHDMQGKGLILESENGIIDGSLDAQLASIDKLFEAVGIHE